MAKLTTIAQLLFGLGTTFEALYALSRSKNATSSSGSFGRLGLGRSLRHQLPTDQLPGEKARADEELRRIREGKWFQETERYTSSKQYQVLSIEDRVSYIKERVYTGSTAEEIENAVDARISQKCGMRTNVRWCTTPKDAIAEVNTLYRAIQDPASPIAVRYAKDNFYIDQFRSAPKLLKSRRGDCDCGTIVLGAMLINAGYGIVLRVIQDRGSETWSHIYLLVQIPGVGLVPLDWSVYPFRPMGWEAPGAREVARTGRPAGIVVRVKDFPMPHVKV